MRTTALMKSRNWLSRLLMKPGPQAKQSRNLHVPLKTRRISPRHKDFAQCLRDCGIYLAHHGDSCKSHQPLNRDELLGKLRNKWLPTRLDNLSGSDFDRFKDCPLEKESRIKRTLLPILLGQQSQDYANPRETHFNNLDLITKDRTSVPVPDYYEGVVASALTREVKEDLGRIIIPSRNPSRPVAPNFFVEFKSSTGSTAVGRLQLAHAGAHGARAMHELRNYGRVDKVWDAHIYTLSWLYHESILRLSVHYVVCPEEAAGKANSAEYYTEEVDAWHLQRDMREFTRAVFAFRASREFARSTRERLVRGANLSGAASRGSWREWLLRKFVEP